LVMFERIGIFLDSCLAVALLLLFVLPVMAIGAGVVFIQQVFVKVLGKEKPPEG